MNEQELQQIQQEIVDLEQIASAASDAEERYFLTLKLSLLRNGYRLIPFPSDALMFQVFHVISGRWVMAVSETELRLVAWAMEEKHETD